MIWKHCNLWLSKLLNAIDKYLLKGKIMKIHIETRILRRLQDLNLFSNTVLPKHRFAFISNICISVNLSETFRKMNKTLIVHKKIIGNVN